MKKTLADIAPRTATLYPPPLDAITAGDPTTAERLAREHIEYSRDALLTHLDRKAHG